MWQSLSKLNLTRRPVAVGFLASAPAGMARIDRPSAAGCGYWKLAAEGQAFYTTADDHQNCPVGGETFDENVKYCPNHGVELKYKE